MSAVEFIQLVTSTGVIAGGLGLLKWGLAVERRLVIIEVKARIAG